MTTYSLRLSLTYLLLAALWIFLSDWLLVEAVSPEYIPVAQNVKGVFFISVTAVALYFILQHHHRRINANEVEYRKLFQSNPHPMWVYDINSLRFLAVNDAAIEKYKYTREEFRELKITDIRPPEDQDAIILFMKHIKDKPYHDSGIWRHMDKHGKLFHVRIASHATTFEGATSRVVQAMDVEEQIEVQRNLQQSESKLNGLINNSDDLIWMINNEGQIVTANEAFQVKFRQLLGFSLELSKKIEVTQLPKTGFTRNWNLYFRQAFQGRRLRVEEEVRGTKGTEYYEIILNPIYDDSSEILGVGCFARDITLRKETENRVREQMSRLKEVAWIQSHEVRRPLANIMGLVSLLKSEQNRSDARELINHIEESCRELDEIVKKVVEKSTSTPAKIT